jgi:hypothetical protein
MKKATTFSFKKNFPIIHTIFYWYIKSGLVPYFNLTYLVVSGFGMMASLIRSIQERFSALA